MRPLQHLTDEELRAALRGEPDSRQNVLHGLPAVFNWATRFSVFPGRAMAVEGADLYRHFLQAGYSLGPTKRPHYHDFGKHLNTLGLSKGRIQIDGRDTRPRLMSKESAAYFKAWLVQYPRPADDPPFIDLVRARDSKPDPDAAEPRP